MKTSFLCFTNVLYIFFPLAPKNFYVKKNKTFVFPFKGQAFPEGGDLLNLLTGTY